MFDEKRNKEDISLALAWQKGDRKAGEILLHRYRPLIRKEGRSTLSRFLQEDLEADLVLCFLEALSRYDPKKNPVFAGYVMRLLHWQRLHRLRDMAVYESREELTLENQAEEAFEESFESGEEFLKEAARTAGLSEKQIPVFYWWMQGLTPAEIKERTGHALSVISRKEKRIRERCMKHEKELRRLARGDW